MDVFHTDDSDWDVRLLGDIIRHAIEDYNNPYSSGYASAKRFLFANAGEYHDNGKPKNGLEYYLSYTELDPSVIRRHLKKPDDM